jgi:hypothetical protein
MISIHAWKGVPVVLLTFVALAGCATAKITFTRSASEPFPAKPANCQLEILSTPPQRPYTEIGTFDIDAIDRDSAIMTASELRERVGPRACEVGADVIIGEKGDNGYRRAIVLRWKTEAGPATP